MRLGGVPCVRGRHFPRPAVLRREFTFPMRLWLSGQPLRRRAVSVAFSESRTYRSELVRSRACCARRGLSGAVLRRGFRLAAGVGGSARALRRRAAIFPALCVRGWACWPASLVVPRRAPRDGFGTEEFPCGAPCSPITLRRGTKAEKRLTMALQRTAPRAGARHAGCSYRLRPQPPFRSQRAAHRLAPQSLSLSR